MKRMMWTAALLTAFRFAHAQNTLPPALQDYNNRYYASVHDAAQGVALPFLLQQGYTTLPGVTVNDTALVFGGKSYATYEKYLNPNKAGNNGYYVYRDKYAAYGLVPDQPVWKKRIPYALYNPATSTFNATLDCVGYGTRLLAATGSPSQNAYSNLGTAMYNSRQMHFAAPGWVASAYEIAIAFPVLGNQPQLGWEYVAGNVLTSSVDSLNRASSAAAGMVYKGQPKGGFANARQGDILAFGYKPGSNSNGHFMVMDAAPVRLSADSLAVLLPAAAKTRIDSLYNSCRVYAVPVLDCSGELAHFNDSRTQRSGIGHGTLLILATTDTDVPTGFIFKAPRSAASLGIEPVSNSHMLALTVGRFSR